MSKGLRPIVYIDEAVNCVKHARNMAENAEKERNILKGNILSLIMSTPKDITPNGKDPHSYVKEIFEEIWEELWDTFIDDYKYTIIADDAEYSEESLVKDVWEKEMEEKERMKKERELFDLFFKRHSGVLNKNNFDDILLYKKWSNDEIEVPNYLTKEYRDELIKEIKEEKKIKDDAIKRMNDGK